MIYISIMALAFVQNVAFSMVSRARNRDHHGYHAACSVASNGIWFLTMHQLVMADMTLWLAVPYIVGTVTGSIYGAKVSMFIEKKLGSKT
jgi:uncharacterized membrane protein YfcA